jgi:hypothetical protein
MYTDTMPSGCSHVMMIRASTVYWIQRFLDFLILAAIRLWMKRKLIVITKIMVESIPVPEKAGNTSTSIVESNKSE